LRFSLEALPHLGIVGSMMGKHFDRNNALETRIRRFVHFAHATRTYGFENLIGTQACTW